MSGMLAKVINSSVGTSSFKSLDEVLLSKVRLVGSDDAFFAYNGAWTNNTDAYTKYTSSYITFDISGTVNFKVFFSTYTSAGGADKRTDMSITVKDSAGTTIAETETTVWTTDNAADNTEYELAVAVNVTAGTKYRIQTKSSNSSTYVNAPTELVVCATPVFSTGKCTLTT